MVLFVDNAQTCICALLLAAKPAGLPVQRLPRLSPTSLRSSYQREVRPEHGLSGLWSAGYRQQSAGRYTLSAAFHHGDVIFAITTIYVSLSFFLFFRHTLPSHASAEDCLTVWPNVQPQGWD